MKTLWFEDKVLGKVFVEKTLVDIGFPLLFICSIEETKYLCYCIEDDELYLMAQFDNIEDILENKLKIEESFKRASKIYEITYNTKVNCKLVEDVKISGLDVYLKDVI